MIEGANRLKCRGVSPENCYFFVPEKFYSALNGHGFVKVFNYADFSESFIASKLSFEKIVFVGTGHGNELGLIYHDVETSTNKALTPATVITIVRAVPGLKQALIILGQCFAGIFNYAEAKKSGEPEICLMGATNFDSSLNFWVDPHRKDIYLNFFLFFFFVWIAKPIDIDGDGICTLLDAYKFAGVMSNQRLHARRQEAYIELDAIKIKIENETDALKKTAFITDLNKQIELIHIHQEPWILNAKMARDMIF